MTTLTVLDSQTVKLDVTGGPGPAGVRWRGEWASATEYSVRDGVHHDDSAWIAIAANTNSEPSAANADWDLLAAGGDQVFDMVSEAGTSIGLTKNTHQTKWVRCTSNSDVTVTIGSQVTEEWDEFTEIRLEQRGNGAVTLDTTGVTLQPGSVTTTQQYDTIFIKRVADNVWFAAGGPLGINSLDSNALTGNMTQLVTGESGVSGNFVSWDANGNAVDSNSSAWTFALADHSHDAAYITSGTFADDLIAESNVTQHEAAIDHNSLANYQVTEHRSWETSIAQNIHVDNIASGAVTQHQGDIDHDQLTNYAVGQHRIINDAGTSATELWSANKINSELGDKANDSEVVKLTGDESIAGVKTLTDEPVFSAGVRVQGCARFDLVTYMSTGTTQTINLSESNLFTLNTGLATGTITVTFNAPDGPAQGSIEVDHTGKNRDLTLAAGTGITAILWVDGSAPADWSTEGHWLIQYRFNGTNLILVAGAVG